MIVFGSIYYLYAWILSSIINTLCLLALSLSNSGFKTKPTGLHLSSTQYIMLIEAWQHIVILSYNFAQKPSSYRFNPGLTQYNVTLMYQTYDVTDLVRTGEENATGVMLENIRAALYELESGAYEFHIKSGSWIWNGLYSYGKKY